MAGSEALECSVRDSFSEFQKTMFEIMREIEALSTAPLSCDSDTTEDNLLTEYQSCIKIRGRPILPPLMTPERRIECLRWKREALEVEARLADQRRQKIVEALEASLQDELESEDEQSDEDDKQDYRSADEKVRSAFKSLISKLKSNPLNFEQTHLQGDHSPQLESVSSENTVVEKTADSFSNVCNVAKVDSDTDEVVSPRYLRSRKGSYTLDHPSPFLLAYMTKVGKQTYPSMETPGASSVLSSHPAEIDAEKNLHNYLSNLSQMPEIESQMSGGADGKSPTNPIFNPPTPFANTPTISRSVKLATKNLQRCKNKPVNPAVQTLFINDDSDGDSAVFDPMSTISQITLPSFPSVIPDSVGTNKSEKTASYSSNNQTIPKSPKHVLLFTTIQHPLPPIEKFSPYFGKKTLSQNCGNDSVKSPSTPSETAAHHPSQESGWFSAQSTDQLPPKNLDHDQKQLRSDFQFRNDRQKFALHHPSQESDWGFQEMSQLDSVVLPDHARPDTAHQDGKVLPQPKLVSPERASSLNSFISSDACNMDPPTFRSTASVENDVTVTPSFASSLQQSVPFKSHLSVDESVQTKSQSLASSLQKSVSIKISGDVDSSSEKKQTVDIQPLEVAISNLAKWQQAEIQRLLDQQEEAREQLKKMFEEQQKNLIKEIMQQVNVTKQSRSSSDVTLQPATPQIVTPTTPTKQTPKKQTSSHPHPSNQFSNGLLPINQTPTKQMLVSPNQSLSPGPIGRASPIIPTCANRVRLPEEKLKQLPPDFAVPPIAYTPQMKCRFDQLSALVKGHLTRRLLQTERIQRIISSMRDTMTIALQLHREAKIYAQGRGIVSLQDIELHRRLLQQIFKDAQSIHTIFFDISVTQRMSIIRQDREIREERSLRGEDPGPPKRISAVTRARMQQRKQIQAMLIKSEAAMKTSPKQFTRSQERPWRHKTSRDSSGKPRGVRSSAIGNVRRSLNLNENRSGSSNQRISPPSRKSPQSQTSSAENRKLKMHRSMSSASALTIIHNKPWK